MLLFFATKIGQQAFAAMVHFAEEPCLISVKQATKPSDNIPSPILHEKASLAPRPNHDRSGSDPRKTFNVPLTAQPEAGGHTTCDFVARSRCVLVKPAGDWIRSFRISLEHQRENHRPFHI